MRIIDIQRALAKAGFLPGPIDGAWGRQTAAAVRKFQSASGLEADGIVGSNTAKALAPFTDSSVTGGISGGAPIAAESLPMVWYAEAWRQLGTREQPGPASNFTILQWAKDEGIPYASDDIPWCGLFVAHCIGSTLDREPLPGNPLGARAWGRFGIPVTATKGAVMVFWRESRDSGKGHVAFYVGEDDSAYCVIGGNQSDKVSIAWVAKSRLVSARWPATVPPPLTAATRLARGDDVLSRNEA